MENRKYKIELTEKQLRLLSFVLDKYPRITAGQLNIGLEDILVEAGTRHTNKDNIVIIDEVKEVIDDLRLKFWNQKGGAYNGVGYSEEYNIMTDMHQMMRYVLFLNSGRKRKGMVDEYPPIGWSKKEPMIKVELIEK